MESVTCVAGTYRVCCQGRAAVDATCWARSTTQCCTTDSARQRRNIARCRGFERLAGELRCQEQNYANIFAHLYTFAADTKHSRLMSPVYLAQDNSAIPCCPKAIAAVQSGFASKVAVNGVRGGRGLGDAGGPDGRRRARRDLVRTRAGHVPRIGVDPILALTGWRRRRPCVFGRQNPAAN